MKEQSILKTRVVIYLDICVMDLEEWLETLSSPLVKVCVVGLETSSGCDELNSQNYRIVI